MTLKYDASPASAANTFVPGLQDEKRKKYDANPEREMTTFPHQPVFDAHDGQEEGLDINFDNKVLQEIVDNTNHRILDTNSPLPLYLGHTQDELDETEQPVLVGFADNAVLDQIGEIEQRACIYLDFHIFSDMVEEAKNYTRPSVEVWTPEMILDCVALLKRRPQRPLSLQFSKKKVSSKHKYSYSLAEEQMNPDEIIKQCIQAIQALPEWQAMMQQLAQQNEAAKMEHVKEAEVEEDMPKEVHMEDDDMDEKEDMEADGEEPDKLKEKLSQSRRKYAKVYGQVETLNKKVTHLERQARVAQRKADLLGLEQEGIEFDMSTELEDVADLEPVKYSKHLAKMRKHYNRAPVGVHIVPAAPVQVSEADPWKAADLVVKGQAKSIQEAFSMLGGNK